MRQNVSKETQNNLKKRFQISFRRWMLNKSGGGTIEKWIGADRDFVRKYVADKFIDSMNWSNYGSLWVIDHIVPVRLFDMTNDYECSICFHYKNIMPLLKEDNLYKEGNIDFSIKKIATLSPCPTVDKLKEILTRESPRLDRYLTPKQAS